MTKRRWPIGLSVGASLLLWVSAANAQGLTVSPQEGTAGTRLTLSGSYFGSIKGIVRIGTVPCDVAEWKLDTVACVVRPMPAGDYTLSVTYGEPISWRPQVSTRFSVKKAELLNPVFRPHHLKAGEVVTLEGRHFGTDEGFVWLESQEGKVRLCTVLSWTPEYIRFVVPDGVAGLCHLSIENGVGVSTESHWGTYVSSPGPPMPGDDYYNGPATHNNASPVYYNGLLYAFYSTEDGDGDKIHYRMRKDTTSWESDAGEVTIDGSEQKSKALLTPLVVQNKLYLFYTGLGGNLDYAYYDEPSSSWKGMYRVPGGDLTNPDARYAAVYNTTKERIEVYYVLDGTTTDINFLSLDLATGKWSSKVVIPGKTGLLKNLSGVFFQKGDGTYVTYLTFATDVNGTRAIWVYQLVDGTVVKADTNAAWVPNCQRNAPYLADLGQDRMALLWGQKVSGSADWDHYYHIFDKDKQAWSGSPVKAASATNTDWSPTGAIQYVRTADSSSVGGYRWDARFCLFYGRYYDFDDRWFMKEVFKEGYWKGVGTPTVVDFIYSMKETFATWPLLAVLDLPPFLVNSSTTDPLFPCEHEDDCTRIEFTLTSETTTTLDGSLEAGVYFGKEAKKHSPLTFDFSAGASAALGSGTTLTVERIDRLVRNTEGKVLALYLAPQVTTSKMEWYNYNSAATGQYSYPIRVTGYALSTNIFNPEEGPCEPCNGSNEEECCEGVTQPYFDTKRFPVHAKASDKERLATYPMPDPTYSVALSTNGSWSASGSGGVKMQVDKDHTTSYGGYFKFKIGAEFARAKGIGGGVEGSFDVKYTTTTKSGVIAEAALANPEPTVKGTDVKHFDVTAYWMDSVENSFWIPVHRKGQGDSPWFLTYQVFNVQTY